MGITNMLSLEDRSLVERTIASALKCTIDSHGPITVGNRASAAKRIYSMLKCLARSNRQQDETVIVEH